jgi:hypothetical protein
LIVQKSCLAEKREFRKKAVSRREAGGRENAGDRRKMLLASRLTAIKLS